MPIDRPAALRKAQKFLREEKLEAAIAEYVRLVEDQPRDWNTVNTLGDLYLRAGQPDNAVEQFTRVADGLREEGFLQKAGAHYKKILKLKPEDEHALVQSAEIAVSQGLLADARSCLRAVVSRRRARGDTRGVAQVLIRLGSLDPADFEALREAALLAPNDEEIRAELVRALIADQAPEIGFQVVDFAADIAVAQSDWTSAAAVLQHFVARVPNHIPALMRLVEVCIDGGLEAPMYSAQARLADAYLAAGSGVQARSIAEDLVAREPWEHSNIDRFRRALVLTGEPDPDGLIAERLSGETPFMSTVPSFAELRSALEPPGDLGARAVDTQAEGELEPPDPFALSSIAINLDAILNELDPPAVTQGPRQTESVEVDLSAVLTDIKRPAPAHAAPTLGERTDQRIREGSPPSEEAEQHYERGLALREAGRTEEGIRALEAAARAPGVRFQATSLIGRMYRERGLVPQAIEWFEHAAQAPAPTAADSHLLLFELAEALESIGETARALAICLELQVEAGDYKDIAARVDRLAKVQTRG